MKRLTEKDLPTLRSGQRFIFKDLTGEGHHKSVHNEVYKLEEIRDFEFRAPSLLRARSVKTGTAIIAHCHRFSLQPPMMEENE